MLVAEPRTVFSALYFLSFRMFSSVISIDPAGYEEPWFLKARTERAVTGTRQYQETQHVLL
jgi:hypothetical protein